ncbi:MAG TPA: polysaccharide biosynthesis/export family protein [Puia sp.]|jgi:polysaccharide export outer membrane protein|nr:polysaccharide biosynthesis/export family protein [Puia sp.]
MEITNKNLRCTAFFSVLIVFASCTGVKKAIYFRNQQDAAFLSANKPAEIIIDANDILSIMVSSSSPEASAVFNAINDQNISSSTAAGLINQTSGYLVSKDGFIFLPLLGKIKAGGLSKDDLQDTITQNLVQKKLLIDPVVNVRILNFKVTVLGEVEHPGVMTVPSEKISMLEAFGLAGDLTVNAQRDNILLIREEGGKKILKRLNLNSSELFTSPYYYLRSNDVVYVEPNKVKVRNNGNTSLWVSVILSTLSFGIILLDHINN